MRSGSRNGKVWKQRLTCAAIKERNKGEDAAEDEVVGGADEVVVESGDEAAAGEVKDAVLLGSVDEEVVEGVDVGVVDEKRQKGFCLVKRDNM
jgi:hypothetical protein